MGPRADFACLSKRCRQDDGAAAVYELPVAASRCPVCGSKRLQRLFNAVNVASGIAKRTDALVEPAYEEATRRIPQAASGVRAVPVALNRVAATVQQLSGGAAAVPVLPDGSGSARPRPERPAGMAGLPLGGPRPQVAARDREWRIAKTAAGPEMARA